MTKNVRVQYFAILREQRGLAAETVPTQAETLGDLYAELRGRHGFSLPAERLRAAVNDEFSPWTTAVGEGDLVVFIPPVAGG
jgi:molybdopterin converting factor small subunit